MELMGIADEGAVTIDGQIEVTQALGWRWIESRFVEVEGFEKGSIHEIPDAAFDVVADKLEESGVGIYAFGSTICNWQKTVETPFDVTLAEVARAIPRMKRLGTKYVRIMSFKPDDDAATTPPEVFERVGEVTQELDGIDRIMAMGFNWAPPGVLADALGAKSAVALIEGAGLAIPKALADAARNGKPERFFNHPQINRGRFFVAG